MESSLDEDFGLSIVASPSIASPRTVLVRRPKPPSAPSSEPSPRRKLVLARRVRPGETITLQTGEAVTLHDQAAVTLPVLLPSGTGIVPEEPWRPRADSAPVGRSVLASAEDYVARLEHTHRTLRELEQLEAGEFGRHSRREQFQIDLEEAMASQQTPSPPDRRRLLDDLGTRRRERLRRVQDAAAAVEAELSVVPPGPTHGSPKRISLTVEPPRSPSSTPEEGGPSRRLQPFELIAAGREANQARAPTPPAPATALVPLPSLSLRRSARGTSGTRSGTAPSAHSRRPSTSPPTG